MSAGRLFLWASVAIAAVTFIGAVAAGASWATRFRGAEGDAEKYDELLDEALEKLERGDVAGARKLTDRVLAIDPEDPIARANLGRIFKGQGDYARAIAEHKLALSNAPELPDLYYNVACYYALMKRKEDAILWLGKALEHGFGRMEALRTDPDLSSLRGDDRFDVLARTGKLPTGIPRVRLHVRTRVRVGTTFEVAVVVVREVPEKDAAEAGRATTLVWTPDAEGLELVSHEIETVAIPGDGMVTLRTTGRYVVRAGRDGIFALPPARVEGAGPPVESGSAVVNVVAADAETRTDEDDVPLPSEEDRERGQEAAP